MQVYRRIIAPYMPNGTPDQTNSPTLYAPGELGCAFNDQNTGRDYARFQLDSGATNATPTGAVATGQLAFWKDRAAGIITNDKRFADVGPSGAVNRVAGVFPGAKTAGNYCDIVINGKRVQCLSDNSGVIGGTAMADTTADVSRVVGGAAVNTAPVTQVVGYNVTTPADGSVYVDVNLGFIE